MSWERVEAFAAGDFAVYCIGCRCQLGRPGESPLCGKGWVCSGGAFVTVDMGSTIQGLARAGLCDGCAVGIISTAMASLGPDNNPSDAAMELARDACYWVAFKRLWNESPDLGERFTDQAWALMEAYAEGQILPPGDLAAEYKRQVERAIQGTPRDGR